MKKCTLAFALFAILPVVSANAYNNVRRNSSYYSGRSTSVVNNIYYNQTSAQYVPYYVQQQNNTDYKSNYYNRDTFKSVKKQETNSQQTSQMRKYFLVHPFFQPLEGKFGSVTDVSYANNHFNFDILNGSVLDIDKNSATYNSIIADGIAGISGKAETTQLVVKEDFSYGISDTLSIIGMAQYDKTEVTFKDWSGGEPSDSTSSSGINVFGLGLQKRFVDNEKWIANFSGFYQHQKDTANTFIGEVKAGYKVSRTTLYGLGRLGYSDLIEGDIYGAYVDAPDGDWIMLSYNTDVKDVMYIEGGVGIFSVLSKDFTLNGEMVFGKYDWHNQISVKGAIGWQPGDSFALNLYASTSVYDSGKGKVKEYMNYDVNPDVTYFPVEAQGTHLSYTMGDYKIKDYNEWKIGAQVILYF
nr:hypothetical protein [Candidatus Enterousia merdequi]